jgi:hypothetical protein
MTFDAGTDITTNGTITKSTGSDATLNLIADNSIFVNANIASTDTLNSLTVTLNSDSDNSNAGQITVTNAVITSNNGDITLGGGVNPLLDSAVGTDATNKQGVFLNNGDLSAGSGNISIRGTGWTNAGTNGLIGVYLVNSAVVQTTTGDINFYGVGGNGTDSNQGVRLQVLW